MRLSLASFWRSWRGPILFLPLFLPHGARTATAGALAAIFAVEAAAGPRDLERTLRAVFVVALMALVIAWDQSLVSEGVWVGAAVAFVALGFALGFRDQEWWTNVSRARKIRYGAWLGAVALLAMAGTVDLVHQARALKPGDKILAPSGWVLVCFVAIAALTVAAGLLVFGDRTPWLVVVIWAVLGASTPLVVAWPTVVAMDETRRTGIVGSCVHGDCAAFASGLAGFLTWLALGVFAIWGIFMATHGMKRLLSRKR